MLYKILPFQKRYGAWAYIMTWIWTIALFWVVLFVTKTTLNNIFPDPTLAQRLQNSSLLFSVAVFGGYILSLLILVPATWIRAKNSNLPIIFRLIFIIPSLLFSAWALTQSIGYSYNAPTTLSLIITAIGWLYVFYFMFIPLKKDTPT
jgi:hypothetical protein